MALKTGSISLNTVGPLTQPDTITPADAAAEIVAISHEIRALSERKDVLQGIIGAAIDLGALDDCLMADDKGYALGNIRCCPVRRSTWEYDYDTKRAIKQLQEQSKVEGLALEKTSLSYRFTVISDDE